MRYNTRAKIGNMKASRVTSLPTWSTEDIGRIIYVTDELNLYYADTTDWINITSAVQSDSNAGLGSIEIRPAEFSSVDAPLDELFGMLPCYRFDENVDSSVFFDFKVPPVWSTENDISMQLCVALTNGAIDTNIYVKTEVWIASNRLAALESFPDFTFYDTITSDIQSQDAISFITLLSGKVPLDSFSNIDTTIVVKMTRLALNSVDTYSGSLYLIKVFAKQQELNLGASTNAMGQVVNKVSDYFINDSENNSIFTTYGATGSVRFILPDASREGLRFVISKSEVYPVSIATHAIVDKINSTLAAATDGSTAKGINFVCTTLAPHRWSVSNTAPTTVYGGSGSDGSAVVSSSVNLSTNSLVVGRSVPDAVSYSVTGLTNNTAVLSVAPSLVPGDEVLLINLQGTSTNYSNVGNYETFTVQSVNGLIVTFTSDKTRYYGNGASDDSNIGVTATNQRVALQRIPNYYSLAVSSGSTLFANAWDGTRGGVLFIRVAGELIVDGTIDMTGKGYRGAPSVWRGNWRTGSGGESISQAFIEGASGQGAGNGGWTDPNGYGSYGGAGASYGTAGSNGCTWYNQGHGAYAGVVYGVNTLDKIFLGSSGGCTNYIGTTSYSGPGGGIIGIFASKVTARGSILTKGGSVVHAGGGGPGGGSGGSLLITAPSLVWSTPTVLATGSGGGGGSQWGGSGGSGRIAIYYTNVTGSISATPAAYTSTI